MWSLGVGVCLGLWGFRVQRLGLLGEEDASEVNASYLQPTGSIRRDCTALPIVIIVCT